MARGSPLCRPGTLDLHTGIDPGHIICVQYLTDSDSRAGDNISLEACTPPLSSIKQEDSNKSGLLLFGEDLPELIYDEGVAIGKLSIDEDRKEFAWCICVEFIFDCLCYMFHNTTILSQMCCFVNTIQ